MSRHEKPCTPDRVCGNCEKCCCIGCDEIFQSPECEALHQAVRDHEEDTAYAQYMNVEEHFIYGG